VLGIPKITVRIGLVHGWHVKKKARVILRKQHIMIEKQEFSAKDARKKRLHPRKLAFYQQAATFKLRRRDRTSLNLMIYKIRSSRWPDYLTVELASEIFQEVGS
jgi:hypothetical protein